MVFYRFLQYNVSMSLAKGPPTAYFPFLFIIFLLGLALCVPAHAQTAEQPVKGPGFFIAPLAEVSGYGRKGPGFGGGIALGMGDVVSAGFRLLYSKAMGAESINTLEIAVFMRFFPFSSTVPAGFFFQIEGGGALFAHNKAPSFPADAGGVMAGITAGWRFPLGNRWYIEPSVRAGYPYIAAAGVSAAFRF